MKTGNNWSEVVRPPFKGYAEQRFDDMLFYAPLLNMVVDNESPHNVRIQFRWVAKRRLSADGSQVGDWQVVHAIPVELIRFPNETLAYLLDTTPDGSRRIYLGNTTLFLDVEGKIKESEIPGLNISQ
jgi:hypothetical protein